jgi:hypothetical protein
VEPQATTLAKAEELFPAETSASARKTAFANITRLALWPAPEMSQMALGIDSGFKK